MRKVLIANRGEIAVRVIRAARDAGLASVAVYAEPDRDALHVRMADEAFALGGNTPAESYLVIDKVIAAATKSGADAVHPGYGFLVENADFAEAVGQAGLTWIGPSPQSIRELGDKVTARHIALRAGAPLVPGTKDPVAGPDEVLAFAEEHGLPVAIKAAFGGGGRGLKIAHTMEEIPELYASAVREAVSAFGRGECFVERYLERSRHVEAQVLADTHGNVIVVGTRDCSLQRRNQKLVEEAPAPFLTDEQRDRIHSSAKAICREAGYHGAGTVEYLVGNDGVISFLEVNTRLQVEHPVSEETTGLDLVREQFRIADGEPLRITEDPGAARARLRVPDQRRGSGTRLPAGTGGGHQLPGAGRPRGAGGLRYRGQLHDRRRVRLAAGQADRLGREPGRGAGQGPPRAGRVRGGRDGHRAAVPPGGGARPGLRAGRRRPVHACSPGGWRPSSTTRSRRSPAPQRPAPTAPSASGWWSRWTAGGWRCRCRPGFAAGAGGRRGPAKKAAPKRSSARRSGAAASGDALTAPMQGTIVKVAVSEGDTVAAGDLIVVLEAMKMEQPINAHKAGTVTGLNAETGAVVASGAVICELKD